MKHRTLWKSILSTGGSTQILAVFIHTVYSSNSSIYYGIIMFIHVHSCSSIFIHMHLEFPSAIGHPFEKATLSDQRCRRLFNSSSLFTLSCPNPHKQSHNSQGSLIDEIKNSKQQLAFWHYQFLFPLLFVPGEGRNNKHIMCRLVDSEIRTIVSKTESTLKTSIKHQTFNCSPQSSRSEALLKSLKAFRHHDSAMI